MNLSNFQWLVGPIVGAIIGLITNGIAIRMLFRPLYPIKIFGITLPFTPGLIPKEKPRIAHSIGRVVAEQLVNAEVLEKGMLTPEIDKKLIFYVDQFLNRFKNSSDSIKDLILKFTTESKLTKTYESTKESLSLIIYKKAVMMNIGKLAMNAVNKEFERRMREDPTSIQFMPMILSLVEDRIIFLINDTIEKQGLQIIQQFFDKEATTILDYPVSKIYDNCEKYIPQLNKTILDIYHYSVKNYLPNVLKEINIAKLVEDKINDFSLIELEKMLLDLMRKELNAIVYLGGLLGLLMGFIMNWV